jgi:hypothetical protein
MLDELAEAPKAMTQARALRNLGSKPLIVVTAGSGQQAGGRSAQDDLARLSANSTHRVAPNATHASLMETEDDAATSSQAIRDVVEAVQAQRPLTES